MGHTPLPDGVAVVTGATGGMGSEVARALAEAGWPELLICDLDTSRLEAVATPLRDDGTKVEILAGDVADPAWPGQLVATLADRPISALVHTAGISPSMAPPERILDVNLGATTRLVDAIRPRMVDGSAAVLFASNSSYFPLPDDAITAVSEPLPPGGTAAIAHLAPTPQIAYPLSKFGVRALVKREAKSFGANGARLVSISPGAVDTRMTQLEVVEPAAGDSSGADVGRRMIEAAAIPRMGRPEELAAVASFLCTPAASFVTAVDILVDGGQTAALGL